MRFVKIASVTIVVLGAMVEVVAGYHYPIDVVVAPFLTLWQWRFFQKLRHTDEVKFALLIGLSLLMLSLIFICDMKHYVDNNPYTFMILYQVVGLCLGCIYIQNLKFRKNILIPMIMLGGISLVAQMHEQAWINQLKWICIAGMLPLVRRMMHNVFSIIKFTWKRSKNKVSFSMTIQNPLPRNIT
jgi:general stress protein CsbA